MDFVTFLSKVIEALAWPATVLVLAFKFSDRFRQLLDHLTEFTLPGGISGKFSPALAKVEALAEQMGIPPMIASSAEPTDQVAIEANPVGVIMETWIRFTAFAEEILGRNEPGYRDRTKAWPESANALTELEKRGYLRPDESRLLVELRSIRNRAAHSKDIRPTPDDAKRFVSLVERLEQAWAKRFGENPPLIDIPGEPGG